MSEPSIGSERGARPERDYVVVTGASRGIGRATAIAFARRGLDVALLGRASTLLDEAASLVRAEGAQARVGACDVAREHELDRVARELLEERGAPLAVVNNAGIVRRGHRVEDTPLEHWDEVMSVNLRAPFLVSRAFLPSMRQRGRGRFVHVGSISSTIGCPENASYAASKWGLVGFAKSLAEELRGSELASIAVLPGSVDTDMLVGSGFAPAMTASDVASTIVFAALDAPLAMNGSAIEIFG
jgi:3-oxoacyl-[acyl-carrier protein] reductase